MGDFSPHLRDNDTKSSVCNKGPGDELVTGPNDPASPYRWSGVHHQQIFRMNADLYGDEVRLSRRAAIKAYETAENRRLACWRRKWWKKALDQVLDPGHITR
jgi:hypothetical protein